MAQGATTDADPTAKVGGSSAASTVEESRWQQVATAKKWIQEARVHAASLKDALAANDEAQANAAQLRLERAMDQAASEIARLKADTRPQLANDLAALRVAVNQLIHDAPPKRTPADDAKTVAAMGHTNQPEGVAERAGPPGAPGIASPPNEQQTRPFREVLHADRPQANGSYHRWVNVGQYVEGKKIISKTIEEVVDREGRVIGVRDPDLQAPEKKFSEKTKIFVGKLWNSIEKAFVSPEERARRDVQNTGNGFTGVRG